MKWVHAREPAAFLRNFNIAADDNQAWSECKRALNLRSGTPRPVVNDEVLTQFRRAQLRATGLHHWCQSYCRTHLAYHGKCLSLSDPTSQLQPGLPSCPNEVDAGKAFCAQHADQPEICTTCEPPVVYMAGPDGQKELYLLPWHYECEQHEQEFMAQIDQINASCAALTAEARRIGDELVPWYGDAPYPPDVREVADRVRATDMAATDANAEDGMCPICYLDLFPSQEQETRQAPADAVAKLCACTHIFHASCLQSWFNSGNASSSTCPSCRADVFNYESND